MCVKPPFSDSELFTDGGDGDATWTQVETLRFLSAGLLVAAHYGMSSTRVQLQTDFKQFVG